MKKFFEFVLLFVMLFACVFYACGCGGERKIVTNNFFTVEDNSVKMKDGEAAWKFPDIAELSDNSEIFVVSPRVTLRNRLGVDDLLVITKDENEWEEIDFVLVRNNRGDIWAIYDAQEHPTYVGRGYVLLADDRTVRVVYKEGGEWREANFSKIHEEGWVGPTVFSIL